jgi:hypothetical protein
MVRKCSFLRNFVGQRWSVVDRGSERFALVPAPSEQSSPMHDLGYELLTGSLLQQAGAGALMMVPVGGVPP